MSSGKEFQRTDAATGNERRPTVDRRNGGTCSSCDDDERRLRRPGKTVQHAKSRDCHLEIDTFWQTQPMQCCKGVRDVVIATQSINQTSRRVKNRLEVPLLISWKPGQDKIAIVVSRVHM